MQSSLTNKKGTAAAIKRVSSSPSSLLYRHRTLAVSLAVMLYLLFSSSLILYDYNMNDDNDKNMNNNDLIEEVSCPMIFQQEKENTLNKNQGSPPLQKYTKTSPPFWISIHNKRFDPRRFVIFVEGLYYEGGITDLFHKILDKKVPGLVLDIGMNIGWFSLYSRAHGHDVAGFEPNPVMYLRICESMQLNHWMEDGSIKIFPYGLGNENETKDLVTGRNPGKSSFFAENILQSAQKKERVEVRTLDDIARQEGWLNADFNKSIYLMKVDVEGYERFVFEGGRRLLQSNRVKNIIMERTNSDHEANLHMLSSIYENGYRIHAIMDAYGNPYHSDPETIASANEGLGKVPQYIQDGVEQEEVVRKFLTVAEMNIWFVLEE